MCNYHNIDESLEQFARLPLADMLVKLQSVLGNEAEHDDTDDDDPDQTAWYADADEDNRWQPDLVGIDEPAAVPKDLITIRGPMALLVTGPIEPPNALIRRAAAGVAVRWRVSSSIIWYVIVRFLRQPGHRLYLLHPDLRDLVKDPNTEQAKILCELLWRMGPRGMLKMMKRHAWLSTQPPDDTPRHMPDRPALLPHLTIPMGLFNLLMHGDANLAELLDAEYPQSDGEETTIDELLEGCVEPKEGDVSAPDWEKAAPPPSGLTVDIFKMSDVSDALDRLNEANGEVRSRLMPALQRMQQRGPTRRLVPAPDPLVLNPLVEKFPNFSDVFAYLREQLALARLQFGPVSFPPLLLAGPPGVGKTTVTAAIAAALSVTHEVLQLSSTSASFVLCGSSPSWSGGRIGKIAALLLLSSGYANSIVVADELDKAGGDPRYSPEMSLLNLVERSTSATFEDEWLSGIPLRADYLNWIATANDLSAISEPVLSRFTVFHIDPPRTNEETSKVARSVYASAVAPYAQHFESELRDEVLGLLCRMSGREMRMTLTRALGKASLRSVPNGQLRYVTTEDLTIAQQPERRSIGFCA